MAVISFLVLSRIILVLIYERFHVHFSRVFFTLQSPLPHINGNPRHERPIWIWDRDTAGFVWANGEGVKFWSAPSLESLQATPFDKTHPAWLKVCQILDGLSPTPVPGDQPIGISLYFPHMNGGATDFHEVLTSPLPQTGAETVDRKKLKTVKPATNKREGYFSALCRRGNLKNRTALIVEVLSAADGKSERDYSTTMLDAPDVQSEDNAHSEPPVAEEIPIDVSTATSLETKPSVKKLPAQPSIDDLSDLIPKAQLQELARLIKKEGGQEEKIHETALMKAVPSDLETQDADKTAHPNSNQEYFKKEHSKQEHFKPEHFKQEQWTPLEIDLTALAGVGEQDELEAVFEGSEAPYALISLQKIIHANSSFVSELGYDDIDPLINDGADWLFPKSRSVFTKLLSGEIGVSQIGSKNGLTHVRLRSGRKLVRDVLITPVKLTKFDRTLLLLQLDNEFDYEHQTSSSPRHSSEQTLDNLQQTFNAGPEMTSIPLLSAISHEVRTPLNVILGFSEVMTLEQYGSLGNDKYKDYIQDIHSSAQHALSLINDLLDLTKLKAGKWQVDPTEIELNAIVREQVRLMRELAAKRQVRLRSDLEENLPLVKADERSLQQILLNLISNAIKYDKSGGLITVKTAFLEPNKIVLSVSDTGPGMSRADILQAMEPFHQVNDQKKSHDASLNPAYIGSKKGKSGTGLGLPISKALAEANNIDFSIRSEKDHGTEIVLTFSQSET